MSTTDIAQLVFLTVNDVYDIVPNEHGRGGKSDITYSLVFFLLIYVYLK